jgi:hypothetical protein
MRRWHDAGASWWRQRAKTHGHASAPTGAVRGDRCWALLVPSRGASVARDTLQTSLWIHPDRRARLYARPCAVTRRAQQTGYSRTAIYKHAQRVEQAVVNEQAGGVSYEALWADNARLRAENEALWEAWLGAELLPESKQQEFAVTGSAMGLSLGQILLRLAIILPKGSTPSRATVGRWVAQASRQAGGLLAVLDQYCQRLVLVLCLDEIFFHRAPILMAVEPHSMTWVAGQ